MSTRRYRKGQDRYGNPERRKLEFAIVMDQVKRRRDAFMRRLQRNIIAQGECLLYQATLDHKKYPRISFRYRGLHTSIHAHRLFLIMKLKRPIKRGHEAGHEPDCTSRSCVKHVREEHYRDNAKTNGRAPRPNRERSRLNVDAALRGGKDT